MEKSLGAAGVRESTCRTIAVGIDCSVMEQAFDIPGRGWISAGLILLGLFTLYVAALDQGFLLSLIHGPAAFDVNLIHEALHDARHAAGFPCH
jgi:hypothetical protein